MNATLLHTITDASHFTYAAQSKKYAQLGADRLIVTARGDCGGGLNCSTHGHQSFGAAVSLVQLSTGSPFARIVDSWSNASYALEGQDVDDDGKHLVVADLMQGRLLSFNTSCLKCGPRHELKLSTNSALHVRIYRARTGRQFALVTTGFASRQSWRGEKMAPWAADVETAKQPISVAAAARGARRISGGLVAVELVADGHMVEVDSLTDHEGVPKGTEGVLVQGDYAYLGGALDTALVQVSLSGLDDAAATAQLRISGRWRSPVYVQMVGASLTHAPNTLAFALWGWLGGIATFRATHGGGGSTAVGGPAEEEDAGAAGRTSTGAPQLVEQGRFTKLRLARANRVHMAGVHAWLPLEQEPGAIAAINLSDVTRPTVALEPVPLRLAPAAADGDEDGAAQRRPKTTCYCMAVHEDLAFAFAAPSAALLVYRIGNSGRRHEGGVHES